MTRLDLRILDLPQLWAFLAAKKAPVVAANYRALLADVVRGRVCGCFDGDTCVAIGGVSDVGPEAPGVAWSSVGVAGRDWFGVAAVRLVRAVIDAGLKRHGAVIAIVSDANPRGQRLARMCGLLPTDTLTGEMRTWISFGDVARHGRDHGQDCEEAVRAGGPGAAGSGRAGC